MAVLAVISLAGADSASRRERLFGLIGFAAAAAGVILSGSRTMYPVIAALPVGFAFSTGRIGWKSLALLALGGAAVAAIFFDRISDLVMKTGWEVDLIRSGIETSSMGTRLQLWQAAWQAIKDAPLSGYGLQNKMDVVVAMMDERLSWLEYSHVHNAFLDAMVDGGTIAGVAMAALLFTPLELVVGHRGAEPPGRRFAVVALVGTVMTNDLIAVLAILPFAFAAACDPATDDHVLAGVREVDAPDTTSAEPTTVRPEATG